MTRLLCKASCAHRLGSGRPTCFAWVRRRDIHGKDLNKHALLTTHLQRIFLRSGGGDLALRQHPGGRCETSSRERSLCERREKGLAQGCSGTPRPPTRNACRQEEAAICIRKIPRCSAKRCQAGRRIHGCHACARKPRKQRTRSAIRRKPPRKQTRRHDGATGTTPPTRDECK